MIKYRKEKKNWNFVHFKMSMLFNKFYNKVERSKYRCSGYLLSYFVIPLQEILPEIIGSIDCDFSEA